MIEFDRAVTCIVGPSFAGKSAILRCLRWLCTNKPSGTDFIGQWRKAPFAFAKLWIDGHTISRKRGKSVNTYTLDGKVLKVPGKGVPQPVADLLNMEDVNFQGQLDAPFWFTIPAPEVSRRLNAIINLGSIDRSLEIASQKVRKSKARLEISSERITAYRVTINENRWALDLSAQVQVLEELTEKIKNTTQVGGKLASMVNGAIRAGRDARTLGEALNLAGNAARNAERCRAITEQIDQMQCTVDQIEQYGALVGMALPDPDRLRTLGEAILKQANTIRKLDSICFAANQLQWEQKEYQRRIEELEQEIKTRFKGACQLCGQPLPSRLGTATFPMMSPLPEERRETSGINFKRTTAVK